MFGVLMKHEFRQSSRGIGTIVGICGLIWLAGLVPMWLRMPIIGQLGLVIAIAAAAIVPHALLVYLAVRYYQSMYGRVGYFTMSLPVLGRRLLWVKASYAFIVGVLGCVVMGLGWVINLTAQGIVASPWEALRDLVVTFGWGVVALVGGLIVLTLALMIVMVAFSISYGSEARFNHLGLGGPAIIAIISYVVTQAVLLMSMLFVPLGVVINPGQPTRIVFEGMLASMLAASNGSATTPPVLGLGAVLAVVGLGIVAVFWTIRSIEDHTSLR